MRTSASSGLELRICVVTPGAHRLGSHGQEGAYVGHRAAQSWLASRTDFVQPLGVGQAACRDVVQASEGREDPV